MNLKFLSRRGTQAAGLAAALALAGCGGGGGGISGSGAADGTVNFMLTDAPACGFDAVNITIEKLRVHASSTAADGDTGWYEVPVVPTRLDLLTLTNGVVESLGQLALPAGRYTQLRLVLAENGRNAPWANSVVPTGGRETALTTPSAQQSGLKMNVGIDVPAGQALDVVIDFDACQSVVKRGNSGQYNLKPKLTVTPVLSEAGYRVVGYVTPAMAAAGTAVSVQSAGVPLKATVPDPEGRFVLYPVPVGNHELVVSSAGRVTAVLTGVPVTGLSPTLLNDPATPIAPLPLQLGTREVAGTVMPASARVRALQTINGNVAIELASAPVDALDGSFRFALPIDSPMVAAWTANPLSWNFVADVSAGGNYIVEARTDLAVQQQDIDVRMPVAPLVFTFP
jgi:hypothetical protein